MALGMIEVYGFTTSMVVADTVAKAADVEIVAIDKNKPAGGDSALVPLVMVVKFEGTAAAVEAGMDAGIAKAKDMELYRNYQRIPCALIISLCAVKSNNPFLYFYHL